MARSLRTRKTRTVGMVIPKVISPFYPSVVRRLKDVMNREGYNVFVGNHENVLPAAVSSSISSWFGMPRPPRFFGMPSTDSTSLGLFPGGKSTTARRPPGLSDWKRLASSFAGSAR